MSKKHKKLSAKLIIGIALTLLVSTPVVVGLFWQPYDVNAMDASSILQAPSLRHIFGTDNFGRDVFSRVFEGAGTTFLISVMTVAVGAVLGTLVGALTGYYGGIVDEILMRINDGLSAIPSILLALVVVSILDKGTLNICVALGIVFIPSFARIMRAEFMRERDRDYVLNARLMGASDLRIIFVHILPNTLPILFSSMLVGLNNAVLAEAGLSYLGLGVQPPDPSLGRMLSEAQVYIFSAPWYVIFTCLVMVLAVLSITFISEGIGVSGVNINAVRKKIEKQRKEQNASDGLSGARDGSDEESGTDRGAVLNVRDLCMGFIEDDGGISATLKNVSFDLKQDEILGIVGESGSGKSMTALSIMGLLPDNAVITGGEVFYKGKPLSLLDVKDYCKLRGSGIAMVFQEPMTSLNPVQTVGEQIDDVLDLHASHLSAGQQRELVIEAMHDAGLHDTHRLYDMYPHELSGGMRQRVMIAMALVGRAQVIIADEPTTALDADVAVQILDTFLNINKKYGTSIIFISHDLRIISRVCDRALVMRGGEIIEELEIYEEKAGADEIDCFEKPRSEYGRRLLDAAFTTKSYVGEAQAGAFNPPNADEKPYIAELKDVDVFYIQHNSSLFGKKEFKQVVFDVSLSIGRGDTVGLVGGSGSGKSTLVKAIAGLQKYTDGTITINTKRPAMVFQDPYSSLNPAKTVGWLLNEATKLNSDLTKLERLEEINRILDATGLDTTYVERRISQLSGGQRQRVAIALALVQRRELIILDEPLSALDVTIQEQILELLMDLKERFNLTYILISHDKRLVARVCDQVYNVNKGHIENGGA